MNIFPRKSSRHLLTKLSAVFIMLLISTDIFALRASTSTKLAPVNRTEIPFYQKHKPRFKEKVALWLFRKKIKKAMRKSKHLRQTAVFPTDTSKCATVSFKTGATLRIQLIEISDNAVQMAKCGTTDTMSISKSDILQVTLSDGVVIYKNQNEPLNEISKKRKKRNRHLGIIAMVCILLAIGGYFLGPAITFILALFALFFGFADLSSKNRMDAKLGTVAVLLGVLLVFSSMHGLFWNSLFSDKP
ncbi:MAG TPA: hypothetical protein ENK85_02800 [Saprospiraceae bacterium]|nr:hypothetical protein [Saprospiraceae bacterium]